jgi:hypothetical protein
MIPYLRTENPLDACHLRVKIVVFIFDPILQFIQHLFDFFVGGEGVREGEGGGDEYEKIHGKMGSVGYEHRRSS